MPNCLVGLKKNVCSELNPIWKRVKERQNQMIVVSGPWKKYIENYSLSVQFLNFVFCVFETDACIVLDLPLSPHFGLMLY